MLRGKQDDEEDRQMNSVLANYAYDLSGNLALFFGCFAAIASLIQMFQIRAMQRQFGKLEARLAELDGYSDENVTA